MVIFVFWILSFILKKTTSKETFRLQSDVACYKDSFNIFLIRNLHRRITNLVEKNNACLSYTVNFFKILLFGKSILNKLKYFWGFMVHSTNFQYFKNAWFSNLQRLNLIFERNHFLQSKTSTLILIKLENQCWFE